jgi:hypothetical protein
MPRKLRAHPRVVSPREIEAPNAQLFDFEGLHGRTWSSSYVIHGVDDREGFDAGLRALFETHAQGGVLEFPYRTVALVFEVSRPNLRCAATALESGLAWKGTGRPRRGSRRDERA